MRHLHANANDQQTLSSIHPVANLPSLLVPLQTIQESIPHPLASIGWHMRQTISLVIDLHFRFFLMKLVRIELHGVVDGTDNDVCQNMIVSLATLSKSPPAHNS